MRLLQLGHWESSPVAIFMGETELCGFPATPMRVRKPPLAEWIDDSWPPGNDIQTSARTREIVSKRLSS
jgi:hypothetical protein